jgi:hypothetical protein
MPWATMVADLDNISIIWGARWLQMKSLNYKGIDLIESYKFHIKFIYIRVHTKKLWFFENRLNPNTTVVGHCSTCNRCGPWHFVPTAMGYDSCNIVLLNFETVVYFCKMKKNKLKNSKEVARWGLLYGFRKMDKRMNFQPIKLDDVFYFSTSPLHD